MNVESGDLAILIKSFYGKNTGHICAVKDFVGTVKYPDVTLHDLWRVEFSNPVETELLGSDGVMYTHVAKTALVCDDWLRPIPGLLDDTDTTDTIDNTKEFAHE